MAAGEGGSIINISSAGAVHPRPGILPYAAAKAGLNALTIGFAHTFGPSVRVNAIMAGTFLTDISKAWDMAAFEKRAEGFALRRGGQPQEIVGAALYLASDLSSYTTGSILTVDGGQP
jgi:NAD(P)-dependent dehydrogenase (short-subunit alcohol dehydrogenase family)